jgi:hypothetical protein
MLDLDTFITDCTAAAPSENLDEPPRKYSPTPYPDPMALPQRSTRTRRDHPPSRLL